MRGLIAFGDRGPRWAQHARHRDQDVRGFGSRCSRASSQPLDDASRGSTGEYGRTCAGARGLGEHVWRTKMLHGQNRSASPLPPEDSQGPHFPRRRRPSLCVEVRLSFQAVTGVGTQPRTSATKVV
jgi:hypothetical protein